MATAEVRFSFQFRLNLWSSLWSFKIAALQKRLEASIAENARIEAEKADLQKSIVIADATANDAGNKVRLTSHI